VVSFGPGKYGKTFSLSIRIPSNDATDSPIGINQPSPTTLNVLPDPVVIHTTMQQAEQDGNDDDCQYDENAGVHKCCSTLPDSMN
jgi:hypothetical protein